jgi:hypothetical protein
VNGNITGFYENLDNGFDFLNNYQFLDYYTYDASALPEGEIPNPATLPKVEAEYIRSLNIPVNNSQLKKDGYRV